MSSLLLEVLISDVGSLCIGNSDMQKMHTLHGCDVQEILNSMYEEQLDDYSTKFSEAYLKVML
jgi:hypothetical protein